MVDLLSGLWIIDFADFVQSLDQLLGLILARGLAFRLRQEAGSHLVLEALLPVQALESGFAPLDLELRIIHEEQLLPPVQGLPLDLAVELPPAEGREADPHEGLLIRNFYADHSLHFLLLEEHPLVAYSEIDFVYVGLCVSSPFSDDPADSSTEEEGDSVGSLHLLDNHRGQLVLVAGRLATDLSAYFLHVELAL